ncbi:Uncharacterised protein [Bordetella pertussis]|nr:Uncharacterised protein [Bordetella pertussis]
MPISPAATAWPASSTTRTCTPDSALPTVPPRRSPSAGRQGLEVSMTVSLMP